MEEFNGFDYNNDQNEGEIEINQAEEIKEEPASQEDVKDNQTTSFDEAINNQVIDEQPTQQSFFTPYNPINYTPVSPVEDHKPMSKGLKFFTLLMVAVIALTSACTAGYFLGRSNSGKGFVGKDVIVGLEAKPEKTDEMTAAQVYEKVNPSVVGICVYNSKGIGANASGVIYSKDGYIVTNDHIYSEVSAAKFKIYTHDNKEFDAEYVAGDKVSDLAVLKVKDAKFEAAVFGNSEQLIFGENVVAIGRPGGAENASSITKGIVSATSRRVQTTSNYSSRLVETDCPINPGSSGGALVNMYGQVIGITSSKLASSDIDAVGYAIPTTTVKRIVEELIKKGKVVTRAKLGITYNAIDSVYAEINDYSSVGLYVDSVSEDSDLYGKLTKGDIITHINGIKVTSDEIVLDIIERAKAGDKVSVTYINAKQGSKTIDAVLKANIGESSYTQIETNENQKPDFSGGSQGGSQGGGAFDFPFGE